ncbi:MAG: SpoIID/LytB domain-containing protein [Clostridia bacterium]|nr:SpoIID/LytB domain-containing protein [Clostridia bacterium]
MRSMWKKTGCILMAVLLSLLLCGCGISGGAEETKKNTQDEENNTQENKKPPLPEKLEVTDEGVPVLKVYQLDEEETKEMDLETYLLGVVAGEMKNDWPLEALKAQAILARTFVLKFCTEKESKYQGADISTDIEEAQAYDATGVNERIEQAVGETRGLVLSYHGELPYAWFHAHSGGVTERAVEGLNFEKEEPGYTKVTQGRESVQAPDDTREWKAEFSEQEMLDALKSIGIQDIKQIDSVEVGKKGESGRAVTLRINGENVSAPELRLALDSTRLRSTMITDIDVLDGKVVFSGKGYGHGVGMPQWGAYGMAEEGKTAEEIVRYYFDDVTVEKLW